tara:strand:+ start:16102 stop:17112 length:1011 start_codon:yes stop_codon:yes gene_type:complete
VLIDFDLIIIISCFLVSLILTVKNDFIAKTFNIYDIPDQERKFHKTKTAVTGGIIIFTTISIFFFLQSIKYIAEKEFLLDNIRQYFSLLLGCIIFFIIGFVDDKKNLSPNLKLIFFILTIVFLIWLDSEMNIQIISLSILNNNFSIGFFSYLWTIICFLLFINALNMFDGINLQVAIYSLTSILYIIFFHEYLTNLLIIISFSLICFSFLNYFSKSFLGNSGSYLLGFLLGYIFIKIYNVENNIYADEIVLLMIIPGLDLIRLFFTRLLKKKHPFSPDRSHLHHFFLKKFNNTSTFLIISLIIWLPIVIAKITGLIFIILILQIIFYVLLMRKLSN